MGESFFIAVFKPNETCTIYIVCSQQRVKIELSYVHFPKIKIRPLQKMSGIHLN